MVTMTWVAVYQWWDVCDIIAVSSDAEALKSCSQVRERLPADASFTWGDGHWFAGRIVIKQVREIR